jgi:26S proteasome regulatory subunit N10
MRVSKKCFVGFFFLIEFCAEESSSSAKKDEPMEVEGDEDYSEVMNDPAFLQSVLENLPGVDPQSEAIRQAVGSLKDKKKEEKDDKQKK